jgi:uncharacterized membrane protein
VEPPVRGQAPTWLITKAWNEWFRSVVTRAQDAAVALVTIALSAQTASLGLTTLIPVAAAGLYRVSYRFRVSTAASVSSSLDVTVSTTEGGIACQQTSAAYTGNATNRPQSGAFLVKADAATPIQISTAYASVGTPMVYELDYVAEQI